MSADDARARLRVVAERAARLRGIIPSEVFVGVHKPERGFRRETPWTAATWCGHGSLFDARRVGSPLAVSAVGATPDTAVDACITEMERDIDARVASAVQDVKDAEKRRDHWRMVRTALEAGDER